jgi:hypothetical protein
MKQFKLILPIILFLCLTRILSSCCRHQITAGSGFYFTFDDHEIIKSVSFLGTEKVKSFNTPKAAVTLNPADTISGFRIYTEDGDSGDVWITYTAEVAYSENSCNGESLDVYYNAAVVSHTYNYAYINEDRNGEMYVQISH